VFLGNRHWKGWRFLFFRTLRAVRVQPRADLIHARFLAALESTRGLRKDAIIELAVFGTALTLAFFACYTE
jgi:hypothetical protein